MFQSTRNIRTSLRTSLRVALIGAASMLLAACDFEVSVSGGGTVISDPAGINCRASGGSCIVRNYERLGDGNDDVVTELTAIPDAGYRLSHWRGCDDTERLRCYKGMSGDIYIEAVFKPVTLDTSAANPGSVRFIAVGDFGTGDANQRIVGDAMAQACAAAGGCDFAIGLGDNIYDENPQDTYNDAFERKFEYPFINVDFPFYMSLGNHDNSLLIDGIGNFNMTGDTQVAYSYREDRVSDKWVMPSRFYNHAHPANAQSPLVELFSLDSNPSMSALEINPEYQVFLYMGEQGEWVRNAIAGSAASWKIAYGHHPYLSNGLHGNAGNYEGIQPVEYVTYRLSGEHYRQWLQKNICNKVDVYVAGHDHDLQVLHSIPECGNTIFVVSGAGAKTRSLEDPTRNPVLFQRGDQLGFVMGEINGNTLTLKVHTVNADNGQASVAFQQSFARRQLAQ